MYLTQRIFITAIYKIVSLANAKWDAWAQTMPHKNSTISAPRSFPYNLRSKYYFKIAVLLVYASDISRQDRQEEKMMSRNPLPYSSTPKRLYE